MTTSSNVTVTELTGDAIEREIERQNELDAGQGVEDPQDDAGDSGQDDSGERRQEPEAPAEKPVQMSPQDLKRQQMAERFKRPGLEERPFDGDMTRAENLYGDVAAETLEVDPDLPEPGVPAGDHQQEPAAPRMITRTVRGKQVTKSEDEWLELAMKVDAADTYLEESRQLLQDAKAIRESRAAPDRQRPDGQTQTRDDEQDQDDHQPETRRPGIDLKAVVEEIQFGDPAVAAEKLAQAIDNVATKQVNEGHLKRLVDNDRARSKADLQAFTTKYADLAQDPLASNLIENLVYTIYREEIKKQGVEEAQIPKNPQDLAEWHRLYRVHGHSVSKPADVLEAAKARFDKWRGTSEQPKPAPRKGEARVQVNVDRTERRMAIPVQPNRAVAPRRDAPVVKQEDSRKSAVQEMRRARGQPVT
jgi:hypothetical protein